MNKTLCKSSRLSMSIGVVLAAASIAPAHAVNCGKPVNFIERQACAKAEQGVDALVQYVNRTRMIYALRADDYAHTLPEDALAKATGPVPEDLAALLAAAKPRQADRN